MAPSEAIHLAYLTKPSQRLHLFSELKGSFDGKSSKFTSGFRLSFLQGKITGYMDSDLKLYSTFTKSLDETAAIPLKLDWFSMVNFGGAAGAPKKCNFGVGISIG